MGANEKNDGKNKNNGKANNQPKPLVLKEGKEKNGPNSSQSK